jgi:hypothetical protein
MDGINAWFALSVPYAACHTQRPIRSVPYAACPRYMKCLGYHLKFDLSAMSQPGFSSVPFCDWVTLGFPCLWQGTVCEWHHIPSHVPMVIMGFFSMETHETLKLIVMMSAVSSHSVVACNTKDVCRMFVRCRENKQSCGRQFQKMFLAENLVGTFWIFSVFLESDSQCVN